MSQPTTKRNGHLDIRRRDIRGAFDNINQDKLMEIIGNSPTRFIIKKWLKAGVMVGVDFTPTPTGTPQGGLCKALHKPLYAKKAIMQSNGPKHGIFAVFGQFTLHNLQNDITCQSLTAQKYHFGGTYDAKETTGRVTERIRAGNATAWLHRRFHEVLSKAMAHVASIHAGERRNLLFRTVGN
jgi:hypothetical protein